MWYILQYDLIQVVFKPYLVLSELDRLIAGPFSEDWDAVEWAETNTSQGDY